MKKLFLPAFLISFTTVLQIIIKAENLGTAIIMVTHNISLAKRMHKTYKLDYTLEIM